jgi:hypothetical protein
MPEYYKTILCLANSRKNSGRCIAGLEMPRGETPHWVRPVSNRAHAEISEEDRRYSDGVDPRVLDVIQIPFLSPKPNAIQNENHLIDPEYYWELKGRASWGDAYAAVDRSGRPLWNNDSSSYSGIHDRVAEDEADPSDGSLRLIEVNDLVVAVSVEGAAFGNAKRKVRGRFTHMGTVHLLAITDPPIERQYFAGPDGEFAVGRALLCVSLSEGYNGWAYKLIAAVIREQV